MFCVVLKQSSSYCFSEFRKKSLVKEVGPGDAMLDSAVPNNNTPRWRLWDQGVTESRAEIKMILRGVSMEFSKPSSNHMISPIHVRD